MRKQIGCLVLGAGAMLGFHQPAHSSEAWLTIGPAYRGNMKAEASGSSHVQTLGIRAASRRQQFPGPLVRDGAPVSRNPDDIRQYGDRRFDDGFVFMDAGTAHPMAIDPDTTWFWGYDNVSQYNAAANTLTFRRRSSAQGIAVGQGTGRRVTRRVLQDDPLSFDDTFSGWGLEIAAGFPVVRQEQLRIDASLGLLAIRGDDVRFAGSTYAEQIRDERFAVRDTYRYRDAITDTYVFDTTDVNIPLAPHQGTFDGPFDNPPVIPSPVIPNRPASATRSSVRSGRVDREITRTSARTWTAQNQVRLDVETDVFELWFGPRIRFAPNERVNLHVTPKLTLNYVDVSVNRTEDFTAIYSDGRTEVLRDWRDRGSESKFVFGAGITAGAEVEFENGIFAGIWGGYSWVDDDVDVNVGPNTVSVDVSSYVAGVAVGIRFGGARPRATAGVGGLPPESVDIDALLATAADFENPNALLTAAPAAASAHTEPYKTASLGQRLHRQLQAARHAGRDDQQMREVLRRLRDEHPAAYAALRDYVQEQRADRIQVAMRGMI